MVAVVKKTSKKVSVGATLFLMNAVVQNESIRKHVLKNIEHRMYTDRRWQKSIWTRN